jgi:hypothetical protein
MQASKTVKDLHGSMKTIRIFLKTDKKYGQILIRPKKRKYLE